MHRIQWGEVDLHRIQYNQMGCTLPALLVSCMCLTVCGGLSRLVVIYNVVLNCQLAFVNVGLNFGVC